MMEIKMPPIMGKAPNIVGTIAVEKDQFVSEGQVLANVETGKGNRPIKVGSSGRIAEILCQEGQEVKAGQTLFLLDEMDADNLPAEPLKTELFVIGGGPGGYVAALYAAKFGISTVLAEQSRLGGTCLNCGCIPTKALIQSAHMYQTIKACGEFGIAAEPPRPDGAAIFRRKDRICEELRAGVEGLLQADGVTVVEGHASFIGEHTAVVTQGKRETEVHFEHAIIATGSTPSVPSFGTLLPDSVMDSERALSAGHFDRSVVIIGGGVIGMEFAFLYRSMDMQVYVVEYLDHILGNVDADVSELIAAQAAERGIRIFTGSKVTGILRSDSGETLVTFEQDGQIRTLVAQSVLTATGRRPVTDGLNLEAAGVARTDRGAVAINEQMQTNVPHIYAIGDVTGKVALAHGASHQGIVAVDAIRGFPHEMDYDAIPSVIFTAPEAACVGKSEQTCKKLGIPVRVSKFPFSANGKAKIMGETVGFVKLICHAESGILLGGVIVGPDASALISTLTTAVTQGLTHEQLSRVIFAHPTTSEAIHEADLGLSVGMLHYQG